jgi:hypothetical protein
MERRKGRVAIPALSLGPLAPMPSRSHTSQNVRQDYRLVRRGHIHRQGSKYRPHLPHRPQGLIMRFMVVDAVVGCRPTTEGIARSSLGRERRVRRASISMMDNAVGAGGTSRPNHAAMVRTAAPGAGARRAQGSPRGFGRSRSSGGGSAGLHHEEDPGGSWTRLPHFVYLEQVL